MRWQVWWGRGYEQWYSATIIKHVAAAGVGYARIVYDEGYAEVRNLLTPALASGPPKQTRVFKPPGISMVM